MVQPALQLLQKQFAGDARSSGRLLVIGAELALESEVDALRLLLLAKLQAVANDLGLTVAAMLAGGKVALLDRALVGKTFGALQEKLHAFATAKAADWSGITCQFNSPYFRGRPVYGCPDLSIVGPSSRSLLNRCCVDLLTASTRQVQPLWPVQQLIATVRATGIQPAGALGTESTFIATNKRFVSHVERRPATLTAGSHLESHQTRLRFGGRQPLCGIGVTSRIERTSSPAAARARTADSRPDPGPATRTSTERRP